MRNCAQKFEGSPEKVINLFSFIAEDVRGHLAELGFTKLEDIIGRTDLLAQVSRGSDLLDDLDLNPILAQADAGPHAKFCTREGRNEVPETLDAQMIADAQALFDRGEKMQLQYGIRNTHRAIGTKLSSRIVRQFGMTGLAAGHITTRLRGSAGQSLGAFAVQGLRIELMGDANDYVGKGLSGATIIIAPPPSSALLSQNNTILGNTCLYGATSGKLFAAGQAGERFAVRNSGALAVVEGCGSNACEYMTGGEVVVLGDVGDNFGAGFTGGMAFVYDRSGTFETRVNPDTLTWQRHRVQPLGCASAWPGRRTRAGDQEPVCGYDFARLVSGTRAFLVRGASGVCEVSACWAGGGWGGSQGLRKQGLLF